jgi:predicted ester cyclase
MTVEDNIHVVRRLTDEIWTQGNLDVADEIIAPAAPEAGSGMIAGGPAALKEQVGEIRAAFAPLRREVHDIVADESHVTVHSTIHGTHSAHNSRFPYPVTGAEISMRGVATFRVVDGLIVEEPWSSWNYGDIAGPLAAGTVRRYVDDIWNAGKLELLSEFVTDDHVRHQPGSHLMGIDELVSTIEAVRAAFPDLHYEATVIPANDLGKTVTRRWIMTGTHEGVYGEIEPTGRDLTTAGIGISRFEGGKIAEDWISRDDLGVWMRLAG